MVSACLTRCGGVRLWGKREVAPGLAFCCPFGDVPVLGYKRSRSRRSNRVAKGGAP